MIQSNLIIAAVVAAAIVSSASTYKIQSWRYSAKEAERAESELAQMQVSAAAAQARYAASVAARDAAALRASGLARALESARNESQRLRNELSAASGAGISAEACPDRAVALSDVLAECADRYSEVAGKADRHTSDIRTLLDAFPTN